MPQKTLRNWAIEKLELFFGLYLVWQGVSIPLTGRTGENSASFHYLIGLSDILRIEPSTILSLLFLVPGLFVVLPRTRRFGLLLASLFMLVHAVGTARSVALNQDGAISAPNTYFFIAFLAAWLYLTERNAR